MILKVTAFIWNTNAALSRSIGGVWPGAVKKRPEIGPAPSPAALNPPQCKKHSAANLDKPLYLPNN
jgi:hypothetical protein